MSGYRKNVSENLARLAREGKAPWQHGVGGADGFPFDKPRNPFSEKLFNCINSIILMAEMIERGSDDPRFMSLHDFLHKTDYTKDIDCSIRDDAEPVKLEYWFRKSEHEVLDSDGRQTFNSDGTVAVKTIKFDPPEVTSIIVFHGADVDGLPPYEKDSRPGIDVFIGGDPDRHPMDDLLFYATEVCKKCGIDVVYDQSEKSFYDKEVSIIHLLPKDDYSNWSACANSMIYHMAEGVLDKMGVVENIDLRAQIILDFTSSQIRGNEAVEFIDIQDHADFIEADHNAIFRAAANVSQAIEWAIDPERRQDIERDIQDDLRRVAGGLDLHVDERLFLSADFYEKEELIEIVPDAEFDHYLKSWYVPKDTDPALIAKWDTLEMVKGDFKDTPVMKEFAAFIEEQGLKVGSEGPIMDGRWHKIPFGSEEGRPGGQYRGFLDCSCINGEVISKETGDNKVASWVFTGEALNPNDIAEARQKWEDRRVERDDSQAEQHRKVLATAYDVMSRESTIDASIAHPHDWGKWQRPAIGYNIKKNSKTGEFMIGAYDIDGNLQSIFYTESGSKGHFLRGSNPKGCFHAIDPDDKIGKDPVIVVKDYWSAASVHEATGRPVIAALDEDNIEPVVRALRVRYQDSDIVIVKDKKVAPENSNGKSFEEVAKSVEGHILPVSESDSERAYHMLGLHNSEGLGVVKEIVEYKIEEINKLKELVKEVKQEQGQEQEAGMDIGE